MTIAAWRTGSGEAPIVAIHGLTTDHRSFDAVAGHLRHRAGMLAPDLRGRGESDKPNFGYGLHQHAEDIVRLLDQVEIARTVLVGHSMGGYVALHTAHRHPERVSGIVLLDSGWPQPAGMPSNALAMFGGVEGVMEHMAASTPAESNAVRQDSLLMMFSGPTKHELRKLSCPVMLIRATEGFTPGSSPLIDGGTLADLRSCLQLVRDLPLVGATHRSMIEHPRFARRVAAEVDVFHREIAAGPAARGRETAGVT